MSFSFLLFHPVPLSFKSPFFLPISFELSFQIELFYLSAFGFVLSLGVLLVVAVFLACPSSLISYPGFEFLFVFLWRSLILLLTSFAPAWINSFNSVIVAVVISCNNLFTFSILTKISFQCWFLRDNKVVFFSVMIFFINSTFILSSFVNFCFCGAGVCGISVFSILRFSSV